MQQVLDEKEDLETERDAYKNKYDRLNEELNYILKGDERRVVDIDALIMENKLEIFVAKLYKANNWYLCIFWQSALYCLKVTNFLFSNYKKMP